MTLASALTDISPAQLLVVALTALFASVIGGVAGYGTGALMPLVLVPIVGAEPVVPIIAISALFSNSSRALAFRRMVDGRRALIVLVAAIPTCIVGAYGYTRLNNSGAMLVIGTMLMASVPLRRLLRRRQARLGNTGLAAGAVGYGIAVGGTAGAGIILLSLLMAAGLEGGAVIATDAAISIAIGAVKIAVFGMVGVVGPQVLALAVLIGIVAWPGAFLAKSLVDCMPVHLHAAILDSVVLCGGSFLVIGALMR